MSDCSACHGRHLCPYHEGYEDGLDEGVARERADVIAFAERYAETGFEQERGIFDYFIKCLKSGEHYEEAQGE